MKVEDLRIRIFADGASRSEIMKFYEYPWIQGFTTNPTLMRNDGVEEYEAFARDLVRAIPDRSLSFEVIADEFDEMERQARIISAWGENVHVKIPVSNTRGESACPLIRRLAAEGIKQNVTAILSLEQVEATVEALSDAPSSYVSVFAGRIADTGRDPVPLMRAALELVGRNPRLELLWASPRELLNIVQADAMGCHIITVTGGILQKIKHMGRDLDDFSLDTVKMFYNDAVRAGYSL